MRVESLERDWHKDYKRYKKNFSGDGYVHYHNCMVFLQVYSYVKTYQIVQFKYVHQIYFNNY
jgi:hypothetical protein